MEHVKLFELNLPKKKVESPIIKAEELYRLPALGQIAPKSAEVQIGKQIKLYRDPTESRDGKGIAAGQQEV